MLIYPSQILLDLETVLFQTEYPAPEEWNLIWKWNRKDWTTCGLRGCVRTLNTYSVLSSLLRNFPIADRIIGIP